VIDLGRPALHAEGITVFPDHADPGVFHYLPDRPRLRLQPDGTPELSLLKYQLDPQLTDVLGAGLLSLTVDLAVDDESLERLRRRLAAQAGTSAVTLGAVGADSGSCELILIDRASRDDSMATTGTPADGQPSVGFGLVERILSAASPSLFGDNAATFAAVLSAEGVGLVEQALRGGGLPAGIVYSLQVTGLRPALRASITARWQDVYSFYENRLHGGKLLLAVDVGATIQELVQAQAITISIDDLVPDGDRDGVYQRALDEVQQYVLNELFKPSLGETAPPADDGDGPLATIGKAIKDVAGFFAITYSLRDVDRSELKTLSYRLAAAEAERLTLSPQGTFSVLLGPDGASARLDRLIVTVPEGPPSEMHFDVGVLTDLTVEEIDHLEVHLGYGGNELDPLLLDAATPRREVSVWYRADAGLAVRYRYDVQFRQGTAGLGDVLTSADQTTDDRVIRLDPRELYHRLEFRAVAEGVPFDRYPKVLVDIRVLDPSGAWAAPETLELDATHPEASYTTRSSLGARVQAQRRLRYLDPSGTELTVDWDDADPGVIVVADPLPDIVDLQILASAQFGTRVSRLIVELRPVARPDRVSSFVLTADKPNATWSWAVPAGGDRSYEYRVTVQTILNEIHPGQWLPGPDGATLIVGEGIARLRKVQLILVGKSFHDAGLFGVKVRFNFEDTQAGLFSDWEDLITDPSKPIVWTYPVADPARETYTCQLTYVHVNGSVEERPSFTSSDLLLIHQIS
jgi:hypothetical protein